MATRRTYRVNADSWTILRDILVGTPEEFNTDSASLRGRTIDPDSDTWGGQMPLDLAIIFRNQVRRGAIRYVIYSYNTPIAYRYQEENMDSPRWVVPNVKYSVTTSKHQGKVRTAISQISNGYVDV